MTCRCLKDVERTMDEWSRKRWQYMLVHQGDFEVKFNECDAKISSCTLTFMVSTLWLKTVYTDDRYFFRPLSIWKC
jgi:hypothetical protein